jgi:hypothetical protein
VFVVGGNSFVVIHVDPRLGWQLCWKAIDEVVSDRLRQRPRLALGRAFGHERSAGERRRQ